jgi:hypothetical protein
VPTVLTTIGAQGSVLVDPIFKEISDVFPEVTPIDRPSTNAWSHPGVRAAVDATGRKKVIMAGLTTEVCLAQTSLGAKESFLHEVGPHGAFYVGSPETVAQKIAANLTTLGATRFDLKYGIGGLAHQALMTNIELYGTYSKSSHASAAPARSRQGEAPRRRARRGTRAARRGRGRAA